MTAHPLTLSFKDIDKDDAGLVGGKGANLGEMVKIGLPVPPGFAVTVDSYDIFLQENDLSGFIYPILKNLNYDNQKELENVSSIIQKKIRFSKIPDNVKKEIVKNYKKLSGTFRQIYVAVRSSATAEDMPKTSFAGQQATFLNVKGDANILEYTKKCWASLFTPRSIYYRYMNKIAHEKVKISVIIQKMIQSDVSGVIFSIDPVTNLKDRIVIEAVWGLGEMIVQGTVIPDKYVVQKGTFYILSKEISSQDIQLIKFKGNTKETLVPERLKNLAKLSNKEIVLLAKIADKLQRHYFFPQDSEWAREKGKLYIVQTRPVTTTGISRETPSKNSKENITQSMSAILFGSPASPGIGTGPVNIIFSAKDIGKVKKGDILVAPMTSPDFVPAMKKASAIVTDKGGQTSHAAIVSREMGVPCVVGTKEATKKLKNGQIISVNGSTGEIFAGAKVRKEDFKKEENYNFPKTATKLYINLGEPEKARIYSKLDIDGVGLLRAEFMIAEIGIHPKEAIKLKKQKDFIDKLYSGIAKMCDAFYPRPVVYRATDFKTNEYSSLTGGKFWEPKEPNPMLGFRGAFRYIADPEVFNLELTAIKKVREKYKNLWLMIPFVRTPEELSLVRRLLASEGFFEEKTFKLWMMVELPVNVILFDEFVKVGIDGISIGSNDLTMLILGTDRDNSDVARVFNERSPALYWAYERIIKKCNRYGITSSICGQAPSSYPDLVEELVRYGITSISVNPDAIAKTKEIISQAERKLIR